ncbi:MAG: hypothetical protein D8M58_17815 [Calditrichaeota bacterium]|nr:MAG: hypothetical protein DWQ03_01730 [Calditrichota bacterium]MBL1207265.1 hypothetical protein [Calditrichota bacterium]NOG47098.1 nuclear transport factor 2 family protein [Calditrichota bacterium]
MVNIIKLCFVLIFFTEGYGENTELEKEVWNTVRSYNEAFQKGNFEEYLSYWHVDYINIGNVAKIRTLIKNNNIVDLKIRPIKTKIINDGEAAALIYELTYNIINGPKNKETKSSIKRNALINEDGKWLIVNDSETNDFKKSPESQINNGDTKCCVNNSVCCDLP